MRSASRALARGQRDRHGRPEASSLGALLVPRSSPASPAVRVTAAELPPGVSARRPWPTVRGFGTRRSDGLDLDVISAGQPMGVDELGSGDTISLVPGTPFLTACANSGKSESDWHSGAASRAGWTGVVAHPGPPSPPGLWIGEDDEILGLEGVQPVDHQDSIMKCLLAQGVSQSSRRRPGIFRKSAVLFVTRVKLWTKATAAIIRSMSGIDTPFLSDSPLTLPN